MILNNVLPKMDMTPEKVCTNGYEFGKVNILFLLSFYYNMVFEVVSIRSSFVKFG